MLGQWDSHGSENQLNCCEVRKLDYDDHNDNINNYYYSHYFYTWFFLTRGLKRTQISQYSRTDYTYIYIYHSHIYIHSCLSWIVHTIQYNHKICILYIELFALHDIKYRINSKGIYKSVSKSNPKVRTKPELRVLSITAVGHLIHVIYWCG